MNRHVTPLSRIAAAALATAAAAAISVAGAAAVQAGEPHVQAGTTIGSPAAQLQTDGYGIGGLSVSGQIDIQKPGH